MESHNIHGRDISSFDLPSTHRLPTVSAADALEDLRTDRSRYVSTGHSSLDQALVEATADADSTLPGGFQKGQVNEIWGPPGSGKTTFGLQLASDALRQGQGVVWVDAFRALSGPRLAEVTSCKPKSPISSQEGTEVQDVVHFTCSSLAHFIALLCRPTASCISQKTSLVVIDSLSALVNQTYPRNQEARNGPKGVPNVAAQRLQVLQFIVSSLQKLAATRDVAVVLLTQCATRMQTERGATLTPAINAMVWDQGITTRLVLFRDWLYKDKAVEGVYFAGIQKLNGKAHQGGLGEIFAFDIQKSGFVAVPYDAGEPPIYVSSHGRPKRKLGDTSFEVADSDDEDYGWAAEDTDDIPAMPPQWQGSEDILVGQHDEDGNRLDECSDAASDASVEPNQDDA
ncbi:P-loop containing nucleoside triphosphate hydrolase protein [Apiospora marii]|uniref:P-loop containing nucleoside triphosphate hydrolase protein n=2 Tax=Apiospora marii TaxID=335849 RepID=A0ABR1SAJ0_9PEZI